MDGPSFAGPSLWMHPYRPTRFMGLLGPANDKQPTIWHAPGSPLYRWSFASCAESTDHRAQLVTMNEPQAASGKLVKRFDNW